MHGLYLLWWVGERGISPAIVAAILAAGDAALLCLEVPTGAFADRFGHRASLIVGSAVQILGMLACWLGRGVPELIAASVLVALGDAFRSGADQALLYRTCLALGCEERFQRIEARTAAVTQASLVVCVLLGGIVVGRWGFAAGWGLEVALCVAGLAMACAMAEPPAEIDRRPSQRGDGSEIASFDAPAERAPSSRVQIRALAALLLPAALLDGAASASSFLAQTSGSRDPGAITALVAAIALAEAAGAALAARAGRPSARAQWLLAAVGGGLLGCTFVLPAGWVIAAVGLSFLIGFAFPLRATLLQRLSADHARARVASLASACDMACSAAALVLAGGWRSRLRRGRLYS